jgi:uncharacterized protein YkwD
MSTPSFWLSPLLLAGWLLVPVPAHRQDVRTNEAPSAGPNLARAEEEIIHRTNEFRGRKGLGELDVNAELAEAARSFAHYMARTDQYGHTADGKQPAERAVAQGYDYCIVSENIAYQFSSVGFTTAELAQRFFTGWKESPEHRKNILDADVVDTGVAVAQSSRTGKYYAVQLFGRPRSMEIVFKVSNRTADTVRYRVEEESFSLPPRSTRTHRHCRAPALALQSADTAGAGTRSGGRVLHPRDGTHYEIRTDPSGEPVVVED